MNTFFLAATCKGTSGLISGSNLPCVDAGSNTLKTIFLITFAIVGALAFLFIVIGGARYALSKGEPEKIQQAKNEIKYSAIGLIIAASAAAVVNFVLGKL